MQYFTAPKTDRTFILRLDKGDYVLESIMNLINKEKITDAVVVSGIGTLDYCVLHMVMTTGFPPVEHFEKWENKPLELSSINGIIADGKPHLHTVVSDDKMAYSGHLEQGCRVLYLSEIVIMEIGNLQLTRIKDENNILKLIMK